MKSWRLGLVLVLALLLPLRGAIAATMICPMSGVGAHEVAQPATSAHMHQHPQTPEPGTERAGHDAAAAHQCSVCSTFCSQTPMAGTGPVLLEPSEFGAVRYLDSPVRRPTFVSDGEERPPRTF